MRNMTKGERAYYEQTQVVSDMWRIHYDLIDAWIATQNYDALHLSQTECEQAEEKQRVLYIQAYCNHVNSLGNMDSCPDCGIKFDQFTV